MNTNIYEYLRASDFISAALVELKTKKICTSIRSLAYELGLTTHTALHQMILGQRKISKNYMHKICKFLKLSDEEVKYMQLMCSLESAKNEVDRKDFLEKMKFLSQKNGLKFTLVDDSEIQNSPLYCFILELVDAAPLKNDANMLRDRLCYKFAIAEIEKTISILIDRKYITLNSENYLCKGVETYFFSKHDQQNLAIRNYHKVLCQIASSALDDQPLAERENLGIALNIDPERTQEIKQYLRATVNDFIARFSAPHVINATAYQLTTNLFKVANNNIGVASGK
jgi:uncharacterized protein (TIGR02147 family)